MIYTELSELVEVAPIFKLRFRIFCDASEKLVDAVKYQPRRDEVLVSGTKDFSDHDIQTLMNIVINRNDRRISAGTFYFLHPISGQQFIINHAEAVFHALHAFGVKPFTEWIDWEKALNGISEFFGDHIKERLMERGLW